MSPASPAAAPVSAMPNAGPENSSPSARRAYRLGIANGIVFLIGVAFVDPVTVLPTFVSRLTDSEIAVGLVSMLGIGGMFLPQLFAASYLQSKPYKRPFYLLGAFLRGAGLALAIPLVYFLAPRQPAAALVAFFLCYAISNIGAGFSTLAFLDIIARTIPGRRLGRFFGHRFFWGSLGAIGSGLLIRAILAGPRFPFPADYCLLLGLALVAFVPSWFAFAAIEEPPSRTEKAQPFGAFVRGAPALIHQDRDYRLLLLSRLFTGGAGIALPFYIIYCRRLLGVPEATVGTYLSVQMAGSVLLIPLWAYLNDSKGPRTLLLAVAWLSAALTAIALFASLIPGAVTIGRFAFALIFFVAAATGAGGFMASMNYLFAIAPEERRPLYLGVHNTLFALTTFLPLLGGVLVRLTSFSVLFAAAVLLSLIGAVTALRVSPQRP